MNTRNILIATNSFFIKLIFYYLWQKGRGYILPFLGFFNIRLYSFSKRTNALAAVVSKIPRTLTVQANGITVHVQSPGLSS